MLLEEMLLEEMLLLLLEEELLGELELLLELQLGSQFKLVGNEGVYVDPLQSPSELQV
jgi:hypothetical protein